jgi:hypothetical protein
MIADERLARQLVDEQRVGRAVPGPEDCAERAIARADRVAVAKDAVGLEVGALPRTM